MKTDIASDFLYWNCPGGDMPSNWKIGCEFEVGGAYEDWGFVVYKGNETYATGRILEDAIKNARDKYNKEILDEKI